MYSTFSHTHHLLKVKVAFKKKLSISLCLFIFRVIQEEDVQTVISANPSTSMTKIIPSLEYTEPELFENGDVHYIKVKEQRSDDLHFQIGPSTAEEEPQAEAVQAQG